MHTCQKLLNFVMLSKPTNNDLYNGFPCYISSAFSRYLVTYIIFVMQATMEELEHDADSIVGLLANLGTKISGAARKLESWDANTLQQWISEAINVLYSRDLLPDYSGAKDVKDFDVKELEASDGAKLVIVLFAQWLVRFMCKKLMQLLTTEAAILIRRYV